MRLRRKHPTTPWNTSPEITADSSATTSCFGLQSLKNWSRILLALAAVAGANACCGQSEAQETGRSRFGSQPVEAESRPDLESAEIRAAVRRADLLSRRKGLSAGPGISEIAAGRSAVTPVSAQESEELTLPETQAAAEHVEPQTEETAPAIAAESGRVLRRSLQNGIHGRQLTWKESFGERLRSVLGKPARSVYDSDDDSGLDFDWNMDEHLLPEETDLDVDVYDSKPILVELGPPEALEDASATPSTPGQDEIPRSQSILRLNRDITTIEPTLNYATRGIDARRLPPDFYEKMDHGDYQPHKYNPVVFQWAPTNLYHHPLYFEDPGLERYGHTYSPLVQPFASTGKFATQLVTLPYQMALNPVHSRDYTLGWYRPGDVAPKKTYILPFNEEAALVQAATVASLFLIIP